MTYPADDKRALFVRVVDDIVDQIRTGKLTAEDKLPTARKMAEIYDVASMTAQRALRELQAMGLTYGIVGKGTFVHPEAAERVRTNIDGKRRPNKAAQSIDEGLDPATATYLLKRDEMATKASEWLESLPLRDKAKSQRLQDELAQIHAELTLLQAIVEGDQDVDPDSPLGRYRANLTQAATPNPDTVADDAASRAKRDDPPSTQR
ncbi:GntR family transcriptional regulator [Couchioplanes caeruleus]|uniref:HTH gntR-type domain-containing protein n=2 Tax=Couchioplanes caeruleus TaxID=56438 RepID=A0A1K0FA64_9ACTN|nr:GntR family transcriptional regulator [Couchioplanes caeruleus]OJF09632.1 hypothetical protein BG844_36530 [Couchioplanes caeruleus subsp. caeruleus]ROP30420.1 regulatory GntR family protein [Couchioplanes caeruleus]